MYFAYLHIIQMIEIVKGQRIDNTNDRNSNGTKDR